jgi:RNA polymerase sigma-70 factor (ECF subfamily)
MQADELSQRLSRINTMWTMLFRAHGSGAEAVPADQWAVLQRYQRAVYRYLLGAVRDADAADELAQEFALRFLRGDFHRADPKRGRFRDYLKTVLIHLVTDHHRAHQQAPGPLALEVADPLAAPPSLVEEEKSFVANWRTELLDRTWQALLDFNPTYHAALQLRIENPDMPSSEMAVQLTARLGNPISAALVRKSLQRAHEKFADLLVDEVALSLGESDKEKIQQELKDLDLLRYCQSALDRHRFDG